MKGCSFHFRQAIYRNVQREGLQHQYENDDTVLRTWIRQVMSLTKLPAFAVPMAWSWLREPPPSRDTATDLKARAVSMYFDRPRVNGDFPSSCWTP